MLNETTAVMEIWMMASRINGSENRNFQMCTEWYNFTRVMMWK